MARWKRFRPGPATRWSCRSPTRSSSCCVRCPTSCARCSRVRTSDPARSRLFPRAYLDPTEESEEAEWQALVHPELLRERLDALELITGDARRAASTQGDWRRDRVDARRGAGVARRAQRHPPRARHPARASPRRSARSTPPTRRPVRTPCTSGSPSSRATSSTPCCERPAWVASSVVRAQPSREDRACREAGLLDALGVGSEAPVSGDASTDHSSLTAELGEVGDGAGRAPRSGASALVTRAWRRSPVCASFIALVCAAPRSASCAASGLVQAVNV